MKKEELSLREQALLTAAEQGRTEQVLYYLVTNTDTECRDDYGNTPLILAATGGHLATAELLLEHGADPHASTTWGTTPFLAACQSGCIPLIKRLLAEGADAYAESAEMDRALHYAAQHASPELVDLLAPFSDLPGEEWHGGGGSALAEACRHGNLKAAERMLEWGISPNARGDCGLASALSEACSSGNMALVQMLLKHGADPLDEAGRNKNTPICYALMSNPFNPAIAELMLQLGNDINCGDDENNTALYHARQYGTAEAVAWALAHGAMEFAEHPRPAAAKTAQTPRPRPKRRRCRPDLNADLWRACRDSPATEVQRLLELGADVGTRTPWGYTPLHLAAERGNTEILQLLLTAGAEVDAVAPDGFTPLLLAEHAGAFRLLVTAGADLFRRAHCGWTTLMTAARSQDEAVVRLLLQKAQAIAGNNVWRAHLRRLSGKNISKHCSARTLRKLFDNMQLIYINAPYENSWSLVSSLTRACSRLDERAVAVLLEAGGNVNMRDRATHRTPLFAACAPAGEEVCPTLVKRLLAAGADVNAVDDCGQTPLHALAMLPATPAAARVRKLLLRAGADAQHRDVFGKTAAEYA